MYLSVLQVPAPEVVVPYRRGWSRPPPPKTCQSGTTSNAMNTATDLPCAVEKKPGPGLDSTAADGDAGQVLDEHKAPSVTLGKREREEETQEEADEETQTEEEKQKEGEGAGHEG